MSKRRLGGKWLEIIKEIAPQTTRVAIVFGPNAAAGGGRYYDQLINAAAKSVGVKAVSMPVSNVSDVEKGLSSFANEPNGALIVTPDATTTSYRQAIFAAAAVHRLPAVYPFGAFAWRGDWCDQHCIPSQAVPLSCTPPFLRETDRQRRSNIAASAIQDAATVRGTFRT